MLLFQCSQFRRNGTHARHGFVAGGRQWEEDPFDQHGQEDNRPAPVTHNRVNVLQQPEDRLSDEPQNAVVDRQFQTWGQLFQHGLAFRTGVQNGAGFNFRTRCSGQRRTGVTDDVVAFAVFTRLNDVVFAFRRNPRSHEVVLQPSYPATGDGFLQLTFVHVFHGHFLVRLGTCPQGSAQVSRSAGGSGRRRVGTGIALQLGEHRTRPRLSALVIHKVGHGHVIQAAFQSETLDVIDAVLAELQVDNQLILTVSQLITFLLRGVNRTTGRACVRTVGADQAALCQISTLAAVVEQLKRHIRTVLTTWIQWQSQLSNVTALWIDRQIEHVGFDLDQILAGSDWRFHRCAGIAGGTRNIVTGGSVIARNGVRQTGCSRTGSNILSRQGSLAIILVPFKNHDVGHDCQGDDQDRAFNIHDYSAIEEEREVGIGGTGS